LLEYYVHSDAPLTCRVPTIPLAGEKTGSSSDSPSPEYQVVDVDGDDNGPPYTPLTIAVQGTLQLSHLHIWTDMNVLMHRLSSVESPRKEISSKKHLSPGYIVAGTAYSLPELHSQPDTTSTNTNNNNDAKTPSQEQEDAAMIENARNPWTAGHGSKVIRGEPLTLKFRVSWVSGADSLGWLDQIPPHHQQQRATVLGVFTKFVFFIMAAGIGALFASYYQRVRRGGGGTWRGEGILGRPVKNGARRGSGVTYGNSGRSNGYGGFAAGGGTAANGYGAYGKKD
jgi:hypothetical protein